MNNFLIALLIGLSAGIIDALPMIVQKLDKYAVASAFVHWVVLGLIIPFVDWNMAPWLKGLIIGELSAIPVILIIFKQDKKAAIPILAMSAVLGIGVALAGEWLIN